jgi:diguanylate cyclase (GGDEF)-like protein/PAS domain S-box-containing protein
MLVEETAPLEPPGRSRPIQWAVALVLVLIVGSFSYLDGQRYLGLQRAVRETLTAREAMSETLSLLKDAETGVRGFLFTGETKFLEPYDNAQPVLQADLLKLTHIGETNPAQTASAARVDVLARQELETLHMMIEQRNRSQLLDAGAVMLLERGKQIMDELRVEIARMLVRADAHLDEREQASVRAMFRVELVMCVVIVSGVALAFAGLSGAQRETRQARAMARRLSRDIEAKEAAEKQLRAQSRLQESILDNIGDGVFVVSSDRRALVLNPAARQILPLAPGDSLPAEWSKVCKIYLPDGETLFPREQGPLLRALAGEPTDGLEMMARTRDGELRSYSVSTRPIQEDGGIVGAVSVYRDTTDRIRVARDLEESEHRYRVLSQATFEGILVTIAGRIVDSNENFARWLGYTPRELIGMAKVDLFAEAERARVHELSQQPEVLYEARLQRRDGSCFPVEVRARMVSLRDQQVRLAAVRDITERKRREAELEALSLRDALTGLYNRRGFMELARHELELAERARKCCATFFADLNGMKVINDKLGHDAGDDAIRAAGKVLARVFRSSAVVARLGGDEFAIFVVDCDEAGIAPMCARIERAVADSNSTSAARYRLSMSAGAAIWTPGTPASIADLMRDADARMYEEKRARHRRASMRIVRS